MIRQLIHEMLQEYVDGSNAERYLVASSSIAETPSATCHEDLVRNDQQQFGWNTLYWTQELAKVNVVLQPEITHALYSAHVHYNPPGRYLAIFKDHVLPLIQAHDLPRI